MQMHVQYFTPDPWGQETQLQVRPASRVKKVEKRTNVMLYPDTRAVQFEILTGSSRQTERLSYILGQLTI
jgi:hypothetical protein